MMDPYQFAAKQASLRYVSDDVPGISRKGAGKGFAYYMPDGTLIQNEEEKQRINALAIPPAYQDVWICIYANGHIQATGRDDAGRKQYRYHPDWRVIRDRTKFEKVANFCDALPAIRARIAQDMNDTELTRPRVLAAMIMLMQRHYVRVGNQQYAEAHHTYGATTLRKKHVEADGRDVHLSFKGKNSKAWSIDIHDPQLVTLIKECEELPGYELFKYEEEDGTISRIDSADVNQYLQEITGEDFTAKDFRTWAACYECFRRLQNTMPAGSERDNAMHYNKIVTEVAQQLGHTPAVCKKSYLHPDLRSLWEKGDMHEWLKRKRKKDEALFTDYWKEHIAKLS